ncbi:MAG: FliI/YscN family ATPase [Planctomycetota bacterium]
MATDNHSLAGTLPTALAGSVVETVGMTAAVADFPAPLGAIVSVERDGGAAIEAEVIGFRDRMTLVYPFQKMNGVRRGSRVTLVRSGRRLRVGPGLLGRVVNAHGLTIDGRPQPMLPDRARLDTPCPTATERPRIDKPLTTGVRAIDALLTCGRGQRLGIFAGSGVGKSVLLGMMARNTQADVIVIGLVGERGREVNDFIERDLGPKGLARSVVVVATSDEPALMRMQAAFTATAIAEHFRDTGKNVLLLVDSVTRVAMASREIGLAAGEPPTTRGYPPSTFALLPQLVERAGRYGAGSITAYYSVLVEGDDPNEPVADTVRGLLDGHVWLSRKLAAEGHYPAIDVLQSISRLMNHVTPAEQQQAAQTIRGLLAAYAEHQDLISIGAYRRGSNRTVDTAIAMRDEINSLLRQSVDGEAGDSAAQLIALAEKCKSPAKATPNPSAQAVPPQPAPVAPITPITQPTPTPNA